MVLEIFFAAGCFWGVEKNFESIEGVVDVVSGYSGGNYDNPTYEAVLKNRRLQSEGFLSVLKNIGLSDEEKAKNKIVPLTCEFKVFNKWRKFTQYIINRY